MKKTFARIGLIAGSILITLTALEIVLRLTLPDPTSFTPDKIYDLDYGWRLPGHALTQTNDLHGEQHVRRWTNSLGFNDIDHDTTRPSGVRRILFVGDSFTEGGFPLESSFVKRVESALIGRGGKWETLNMGMGGFGTAQEYKMWEKVGRQFEPEIVVVMVCMDNDVSDNHPALSHINPRPYFVKKNGSLEFLPMDVASAEVSRSQNLSTRRPWYSDWLYHTYFWTLKRSASVQMRARMRESPSITRVMRSMGFWKAKEVNKDWEQFLTNLPADEQKIWDEAFDVTADIFRKFDVDTRRGGEKMLIVLIPSQVQVYDDLQQFVQNFYVNFQSAATDFTRPNALLKQRLAGDSIPILDLLPAFRGHPGSDRLYFRHDGHWNPAGHSLAAQEITAKFDRLGWTH